MTNEPTQLPFVSVIVPVYNDEQRIGICIAALLAQTYPRDRYEVLVVDNGSTDGTLAAIGRFPVTLLAEHTIRGSYAARNTGLRHARGEVIAFTDSDCQPVAGWLAAGVAAIQAGADLVGGNVRFLFSPRPTGAELYDSMSNLKMEQTVRERKAATTANLFVRSAVFTQVGLFPSDMASGGDIYWTQQATSQGYTIVYGPQAEVGHPTRDLAALLKKQYRVGRGHWHMRNKQRTVAAASTGRTQSRPASRVGRLTHKLYATLRGFRPSSFAQIRESLIRHDLDGSPVRLVRVWGAAWLGQIATTIGSLSMAFARSKSSATRMKRAPASE